MVWVPLSGSLFVLYPHSLSTTIHYYIRLFAPFIIVISCCFFFGGERGCKHLYIYKIQDFLLLGTSNGLTVPLSPLLAGLTLFCALLFAISCIILAAIYRRFSSRCVSLFTSVWLAIYIYITCLPDTIYLYSSTNRKTIKNASSSVQAAVAVKNL